MIYGGLRLESVTPMALKCAFCKTISVVSYSKIWQIIVWNAPTHFTLYYQHHHLTQLTLKQSPPFPWLTTPLSLRRGARGEALFALRHFTLYHQPHYPHNCFTTQLRWYCAIIPMNEFYNINALTTQLGTSCSFDSPGLARNEPTPGKRSQGDSTP